MVKSSHKWLSLLSLGVVSFADGAGAASLSSASSTAFTTPNGTFEAPALTASPGYQYAPSGSGWTLANGAGLSRNVTSFTSGNPNAPQGAQVLFLQGPGSASRTLSFPAGYYRFSFFAAQRGNVPSSQQLELRIDGSTFQVFTPSGTAYQGFNSNAVLLPSGSHTVELRGLNTQGDHTAFVDDFQATRIRDVALSGFESPVLPASPGYAYTPSGGPWAFTGLSGLSRDASGFTASNPAAPEGGQVLFLQGPSSASTSVNVPLGGYYRLRLKAALRANGPTQPPAKNVRITVAGTQVGEFRLTSTQYVEHVSTALYLAGGATAVSLTGVDTAAGDHTGLVDDLRMELLHDWQDPAVWGGVVPGAGDDATVGAGSAVCLQGTLAPRSITVSGELLGVQNRNVAVTTRYVMVMGSGSRLELGQELTPYPASATITLNAPPTDPDIMGMGTNFLGAMGTGTLHLHGLERVSWTQLGANVAAGSSTVVLKEPVDWKPGDSIVIVSSHKDWNEAEKRTLASVLPGNQSLTLTSPLTYAHTGVVKSYTDGSRTWTADLRAEVGLLTHNIRVQGDAAFATSQGFGGHVMIMDDSVAYVSGVELYNMGQKAKLGRYPFHWHMLGSAGAGQYFKNSSIHLSYNRAITIHGTESTRVENNFFYDHIGHGVFLEDGSERFNVIKKNVTLLTKRPAPGEQLTPSDNQVDEVQNRTPASYWITNPQNTFEDNVAAGTQGTGYWFALPSRPMGLSATDPRFSSMRPNALPMISFKGNSAHSTMTGFDIFDGLAANHSILPNEGWSDPGLHLIENSTWYANELGIYTGIGAGGPSDNLVFRNNVLVENVVGDMMASYSIVDQSVFVANSGENLVNGTRYAYRVYDGAGQVRDSHFVGWDAANANLLINTGAAIKHPNHTFIGNTTSPAGPPRTSLEDFDIRPVPGTHPNHPGHPRYWSIVLRDFTGGLSGKANTSIVSNHPFMLVGDEYRPPNWERAYRSDHRFALSRLTYNVPFAQTPNLTCTREKAGTAPASVFYIDVDGYREWHQLPVIVSEGFEYTYAYESLPAVKAVTMNMEDATAGDSYLARFKDFGKLGGVALSSSQGSFPSHASLSSLRGASTSGYFLQPGGDLHIKAVATGKNQSFTFTWSTDFAVPPLDTDGDQMTDSVEISALRHPFAAADLGAEFATPGGFEGWTGFGNITGQTVSGGVLSGTSSNNGDAQIVNTAYHFSASGVPMIQVRMKASQNTSVQLFFATDTQPGFSGSRVVTASYTGNGAYQTLSFPMGSQTDWTGTITDLRLDPVSGVGIAFDIDWLRGPAAVY